jgi:hypothetical protein
MKSLVTPVPVPGKTRTAAPNRSHPAEINFSELQPVMSAGIPGQNKTYQAVCIQSIHG